MSFSMVSMGSFFDYSGYILALSYRYAALDVVRALCQNQCEYDTSLLAYCHAEPPNTELNVYARVKLSQITIRSVFHILC